MEEENESVHSAYRSLNDDEYVETKRCCTLWLSSWNIVEPLGWMPFVCEMIFVSIAGPVYKVLTEFQRGADVDFGGFWPFTYLFVVFWTVLLGPITFYYTDNSATKKWWYINMFCLITYFLTELIAKIVDRFTGFYAFEYSSFVAYCIAIPSVLIARYTGFSQQRYYMQQIRNIRELSHEERSQAIEPEDGWGQFLWPKSKYEMNQPFPYPPKLWAVMLLLIVWVQYFAIRLCIILSDAWEQRRIDDVNFDSYVSYAFWAYFKIEPENNKMQMAMICIVIAFCWLFALYVIYLQFTIFRKHILDIYYDFEIEDLESTKYSGLYMKFISCMSIFPAYACGAFCGICLLFIMAIFTRVFWELVNEYRNAVISLVSFLIISYSLDAAFQYLFLENKKFQVKYIRTFVITTTLFEFFNFPLIITAFIKTLLYQLAYATIRFIRPDISFETLLFDSLHQTYIQNVKIFVLMIFKRQGKGRNANESIYWFSDDGEEAGQYSKLDNPNGLINSGTTIEEGSLTTSSN